MKNGRYRIISEINVTSLVDVTMVLLIIFMITAPLMRSGIDVELPKSTADDLKPYDGVVVTLMRDGTIKLNDAKVRLENFEVRLLQLYATSRQKVVMLQADQEVQYGKVIQLMDRIKAAGINNLGLIVQPEKKP
ncbi:MAG: biopolymer transporter ExbD [candidate division KSB1 bacterium]|nr:biopolymer transporter ExbD [candidate division KSB1 bacterium]MDZ7334985.1 biopolymer transporter ExbD [candidate division KSB1 bacterium]MDZ7357138.1 biopolymer transporter ExbD [candidate division KSB1 bacterium]MDZ7400206.1 biopolymer transporter ExbD [candidate division KSB1 bacterium]